MTASFPIRMRRAWLKKPIAVIFRSEKEVEMALMTIGSCGGTLFWTPAGRPGDPRDYEALLHLSYTSDFLPGDQRLTSSSFGRMN